MSCRHDAALEQMIERNNPTQNELCKECLMLMDDIDFEVTSRPLGHASMYHHHMCKEPMYHHHMCKECLMLMDDIDFEVWNITPHTTEYRVVLI